MTPEENTRVVERFDALVDAGTHEALDEVCTPDMVNHALAPGRPAGLAGTREFVAGRGATADRWLRLVVVADGDHVVQYGLRAGSWPGGSFRGVEIPAGEYTREVAFLYRLRDGRICERRAVRDDLGMMQQLGAV